MVEKTNGKRIVWLDIARCFAILSISSNHAINRAFRSIGSSYDAYVSLPHIDSILRAIIFVFSRLGAPIFLMISGALLLEKKMDNSEDLKKFYKHNLLSILITSEIWYFLMFWYRTFLGSNDILKSGGLLFAIKRCIETMFFINQETMGNMWYIPMILCVYLIIPVLNIALHNIDSKLLMIPMVIVILSSMIFPNINQVNEITGGGILVDFNLRSANIFSMYLIYVLLGYFARRGAFKRIPDTLLILLLILSFVACCAFQYWEYSIPGEHDVKYDFAILALSCVFIFETIRRFTNEQAQRTGITYISKISFGIFFVHIFIVSALAAIVPFSRMNRIAVFAVYEIISVIGSIIIIFILSKVKLIKKYMFLIKD